MLLNKFNSSLCLHKCNNGLYDIEKSWAKYRSGNCYLVDIAIFRGICGENFFQREHKSSENYWNDADSGDDNPDQSFRFIWARSKTNRN